MIPIKVTATENLRVVAPFLRWFATYEPGVRDGCDPAGAGACRVAFISPTPVAALSAARRGLGRL